MGQLIIESKDLEKFGVIDPPTNLELANLPIELQQQLKETMDATLLASGVKQRTPEQQEEQLKKIYSILGQAQEPVHGSYPERAKKSKTPTPPLDTITKGAPPIKASAALGTQQTVTGRQPQTLADVKAEIRTNMSSKLAEMTTADGTALFTQQEIPLQVKAFEALYDQLQIENATNAQAGAPRKNEVEVYEEALNQYANLLSGNVPILSEQQVDPEMQELTSTPFVNAFSQQIVPGAIPDYTKAQLKYFKSLNNDKIDKYVTANYRDRLNSAPTMFYVDKLGIKSTISEPVLNHIVSSPTAAIIFSPKIDDSIREQYDNVLFELPRVRLNSKDYGVSTSEAMAMAKVEAIANFDTGQWFQDADQKKRILEDVDKFKDVGIMETRTAFGGTGESGFAQQVRLMMSPLTAFASVTQSRLEQEVGKAMGVGAMALEQVGIIPELPEGESYYDPDMASRIRLEQRKKEAPLYTGQMILDVPGTDIEITEIAPDSVLGTLVDSVARNRGHLDFNTDLADGLRLDGATKLGMQAAGFTADILSPDMAVISGAVKGTKAGIKTFQAQKQVYNATNYKAALEGVKALERTAVAEVLDDGNLISLTADLVSPKAAKNLKNTAHADIRLYMSDDMAKNLEVRDRLRNNDSSVLDDDNLKNTVYAEAYKNTGQTETADRVFFAKMNKNEKIPDMVEQYDNMSDTLDYARTVGYDEAVSYARKNGNLKESSIKKLDKIYNRAGKIPGAGDQIDDAKRMLSTVYGRAMFFETSPVIGGLDNIVVISRNVFGTPQARHELLATAQFTKLASSLKEVRGMPVRREIKPVEFASYNLYGTDQVAKLGREEMMYDLSNMTEANKLELSQNILDLDAPQTYKNYLLDLVQNQNKIFESDVNQLVMKNRDDVAIGRRDVFTTENINLLPKSQQKKLLEPAGSIARMDFRNGFIGQAFDKADDMFGITDFVRTKKAAQNAQKNLTNNVQTFQQARMLNEVQKEIAQLPLQLNRDFKELIKGDVTARAKYVPDPETKLSKSDTIASLIIGPRQPGIGQVVQQDQLENTLQWMLDRCFYKNRASMGVQSAGDDITGASALTNGDIFTPVARREINEQLRKVAQISVDNPREMWGEFQQVVNDIDAMLANNEPLQVLDDNGNLTEHLLVRDGLQYTNLRTVANVELQTIMEELTMGAYFHAEGMRINQKYLVDVVDKEMTQLSIENIAPGTDVSQELFESVVRDAAQFVWRRDELMYDEQVEAVMEMFQRGYDQQILDNVGKTVDVDTTDILKSIYDDNKRILDEILEERTVIAKETKKTIQDEAKAQVESITKQANKDFKSQAKQQKSTLDTDELQEIATAKLNAAEKLKGVTPKSAAAKAIRKARDTTVKSIKQRYIKLRAESKKTLRQSIQEKASQEAQRITKQSQRKIQIIDNSLRNDDEDARSLYFISLRGLPPREALSRHINNHRTRVNPDFRKIQKALDQSLLETDTLNRISGTAVDYVTTALKKDGVNTAEGPVLTQLDDKMNALFGQQNESFGRAMLGTAYDELRETYVKRGILDAQENIKRILQADPGAITFLKKLFNIHQPLFYFGVLGVRTRFHGMNFLTAPFLIYQTLGRFTNPITGINVVRKGGIVGARGANDIAVRSPDGMTFTNRQIYERIERSGVKSEYSFIQSAMDDGTLLRFMKSYENPNVGFSRWFYDNLMSCVDSINSIGTQTDMAWRSSVFVDAIKEGSSVEEATDLARRSLFDYNDLSELERKHVMKATVFWNFQRQNIYQFIRALFDPNKLNRYVRIYKLKRDMNAIFADNNDGKRLPYEMYMPEYTQTRIIYGQQQGTQSNQQLLMSPSIPSLEAVMFLTDVTTKPAMKIVQERLNRLLRPELRLALGSEQEKYKARVVNPEYITNLARYNDDPDAIADNLSTMLGSTVEPKYVGLKAPNNVNGYTYPLDDEQQIKYAYFQDVIALIGAQTAINDYSRIIDPAGTTYEGLSPLQRMLALTGVLTPARQKSIVNQQILNIQRQISELRKMENLELERAQGDILEKATQPTNPSQ